MKNQPVLVIMAAGMGSRFGGLKQIEPLNQQGEIILDFSLYDAMRAGFKKAVIIIKKENEEIFRQHILAGPMKHMDIAFAYQELYDIPHGFKVPVGRVQPWGTGHAMLSAAGLTNQPFAIINADDYYGPSAFKLVYSFLSQVHDYEKAHFTMVGFKVENTLTENGSVSRGVCQVSQKNMLSSIIERTKIFRKDNKIQFEEDGRIADLNEGTIVSMNFWGFTPSIFDEGKNLFKEFLEKDLKENPLKKEFYLPFLVDSLLKQNKADVKVLESPDRWYGITYKEDSREVRASLEAMKQKGLYPDILWK